MEAGRSRPSRRWGFTLLLVGAVVLLAGGGAVARQAEPDRTVHDGQVIKKTGTLVHPDTTPQPRVTNAKVKIGLLGTNEARTVSFEGLAASLPDPAVGTPIDIETEGKEGAVTRVRYQGVWYGGETDSSRFTGPGLIVLAGLILIGLGIWRIRRKRWIGAAVRYPSS